MNGQCGQSFPQRLVDQQPSYQKRIKKMRPTKRKPMAKKGKSIRWI